MSEQLSAYPQEDINDAFDEIVSGLDIDVSVTEPTFIPFGEQIMSPSEDVDTTISLEPAPTFTQKGKIQVQDDGGTGPGAES